MLTVKDIRKEYRTGNLVQKALDGVSVSFREREFVAVLGPSGSGKTTLLNIIGGLDGYDSGEMSVNGVPTSRYGNRDWDTYRNRTIGFVFQSYNLIPHQTILSNVELAMTLAGVGRAERRKRALEALDRVGLADQAHKKPNQLSGGQMQRVAIARALVNDPEIILADEPTGALDSETSVQIMELLREAAKDRLIIMVTHNAELAEKYATRIVRLLDGQVISSEDNPLAERTADPESAKERNDAGKRVSMSFFTAL
jgi:ABC-type lipoprotein export system ATPase subunit